MGCDRISACEELLQGSDLQQAAAVRMLNELAGLGEVRAMHALGVAFQEGLGGAADASVAARWYNEAAELGHIPSALNLGILHQVGLGVPQDHSEAAQWYLAAAKAGDQTAAHNLAGLLELEPGLAKLLDIGGAPDWYKRAASLGHGPAAEVISSRSSSEVTRAPSERQRAALPKSGSDKSGSLWDRLAGSA